MPELPEVETVRRGLAPALVGRTFRSVEIRDPRLTRPFDPARIAAELQGERVAGLERRGKYLVVRFESGRVLLIHLRMTGSLLLGRRGSLPDDPYRRAVVSLDDGSDVVAYRDIRRFGIWLLLEQEEAEAYLEARLGPEPLGASFSARELGRRLAGRRAPVKALLLDQRLVAGLGNIYADEALWRARIHPSRPGGSLTPQELRALHRAVRDVLRAGLELQGATLRDYTGPDGSAGSMQGELSVYGRSGEPCARCGAPIERTVIGGRGTWYCPSCQR